MWKQFTSNWGLILIAILGVGVWANIYQSYKAPAPCNDSNTVVGASPSPSPTYAHTDYYQIKAPSPSPEGQTAEDRLRIWRQEQQSQPTPSPSPTLDVLELYKREHRSPVTGEVIGKQGSGATAVCRDGSYSYAINHRGACSHHNGVAQWLR
jgi:hypothetical protein